jgi:hypothetical protein
MVNALATAFRDKYISNARLLDDLLIKKWDKEKTTTVGNKKPTQFKKEIK